MIHTFQITQTFSKIFSQKEKEEEKKKCQTIDMKNSYNILSYNFYNMIITLNILYYFIDFLIYISIIIVLCTVN